MSIGLEHLTEMYGVPTTWILEDTYGRANYPSVKIGALTRPLVDLICDDESLVYISLLTQGHNANAQEIEHISAALVAMADSKRNANRGYALGYTHPLINGMTAPDDTEYQRVIPPYMLRQKSSPSYTRQYFQTERGWEYKHTVKALSIVQAMQMNYYASDRFTDPDGVWIIPVMLMLAERKRQLRIEVVRRCPGITIDVSWTDWLYHFCTHAQPFPDDPRGRTILMVRAINSYGQYQGFHLALDENILRPAISAALLNGAIHDPGVKEEVAAYA